MATDSAEGFPEWSPKFSWDADSMRAVLHNPSFDRLTMDVTTRFSAFFTDCVPPKTGLRSAGTHHFQQWRGGDVKHPVGGAWMASEFRRRDATDVAG